MRRISRDVMRPTHFCFMSRVVAAFRLIVSERSTTIIPFNLRSMQRVIASQTVASLDITGSTHRSVCFRFRTSDILTSDILCRGTSSSPLLALVLCLGLELGLDVSPATCGDKREDECFSEAAAASSNCVADDNWR